MHSPLKSLDVETSSSLDADGTMRKHSEISALYLNSSGTTYGYRKKWSYQKLTRPNKSVHTYRISSRLPLRVRDIATNRNWPLAGYIRSSPHPGKSPTVQESSCSNGKETKDTTLCCCSVKNTEAHQISYTRVEHHPHLQYSGIKPVKIPHNLAHQAPPWF